MLHCAKNNIPLGVLKTDAVVLKLFTEFFQKENRRKIKSCHETPLKMISLEACGHKNLPLFSANKP